MNMTMKVLNHVNCEYDNERIESHDNANIRKQWITIRNEKFKVSLTVIIIVNRSYNTPPHTYNYVYM